ELRKRMNDRGVRWPNGVKHVAGDEHQIGRDLDDLVDRPPERRGDVCLALIDPGRCLPLILAETQVQIGYVDQPHGPKYRPRNALRYHHGTVRTHCVTFIRNRIAAFVLPEVGDTVERTV